MPTFVPEKPQPIECVTTIVGNPVSATAWGRVTASQIAFLQGRALQFVCANYLGTLPARTTSALSVPVQWRPSPGCRLAAIFVELKSDDVELLGTRFIPSGNLATISVTVPTGAGVINAPVLSTLGPIDGSTSLENAHPEHSNRYTYCALIHTGNAGSVTDDYHDLTVTVTPAAGSDILGIESVCLIELPLSNLQPENGEIGALFPVIDPRNDLADSDPGNGIGVPYLVTGEQACATALRTHFQVCTYRDSSNCWFTTSASYAALNFRHTSAITYNPTFRVRARRIHGDDMPVFTRIHYAATDSSDVEITVTPVGGAPTVTTFNLPSTGGVFQVATNSSLSLSNTGTNQECDVSYRFRTASGTLNIASIAHIQNETN